MPNLGGGVHQHSGSCSNCSRVVGDEPSESAVVGVAPMALGRRSARRHDRCLGLSQQGSADGSSRSRSERRDGRCWVVQVQSGHRDARPDRPGLDLGGGTAAAGSARSRSGSLTPLLGHPGLDPGALHPCWVVQVWIQGGTAAALGAANKASRLDRSGLDLGDAAAAAGSARSRSGSLTPLSGSSRSGSGGGTAAALGAANKAARLDRPGQSEQPPLRTWSVQVSITTASRPLGHNRSGRRTIRILPNLGALSTRELAQPGVRRRSSALALIAKLELLSA